MLPYRRPDWSWVNPANASFPTRYQYTGREFDSFSGLQYSRARWYDPKIGRFISEDPIGFRGGDVNLYGYVRNRPLIYRDSKGLFPDGDVLNPNVLTPFVNALTAIGSALGIAASEPAVVVGAGFLGGYAIGYYPGQALASWDGNPFVNGKLNPFPIWDGLWETPPYPAVPPAISTVRPGPACQPRPRAIPWTNSWPPIKYPIPLGPYPPKTPKEREDCVQKCAHLLGIGDNGVQYLACYRKCVETID